MYNDVLCTCVCKRYLTVLQVYNNTIDFLGNEQDPVLGRITFRHFSSTHMIKGLNWGDKSARKTTKSAITSQNLLTILAIPDSNISKEMPKKKKNSTPTGYYDRTKWAHALCWSYEIYRARSKTYAVEQKGKEAVYDISDFRVNCIQRIEIRDYKTNYRHHLPNNGHDS